MILNVEKIHAIKFQQFVMVPFGVTFKTIELYNSLIFDKTPFEL
jgi:hypothetical protein